MSKEKNVICFFQRTGKAIRARFVRPYWFHWPEKDDAVWCSTIAQRGPN